MACPSNLGFSKQGVDAQHVGLCQHLSVRYPVLPFYLEKFSKAGHVKVIQLILMATVDSQSLTGVDKDWQNSS